MKIDGILFGCRQLTVIEDKPSPSTVLSDNDNTKTTRDPHQLDMNIPSC